VLKRRALLTWGGLAVSALFTYLALRHVDLHETWKALEDSNYIWLLPAAAAIAVAIPIRALRWRLLFEEGRRPPLGPLTEAMLIGYFFNAVLPARTGEAARVIVLHQRAGTSRIESLGTAVVERAFDVFVLIGLLVVASPVLPRVTWLRACEAAGLVLTLAMLASAVVLRVYGDRPFRFALRPVARLLGGRGASSDAAAANLTAGLAALRDAKLAAIALVLTAVSWLLVALSNWFMLIGFDFGLGFSAAIVVLVAINLSHLIPSSPGNVGVFESAVKVALAAWSIDPSRALSFALVLHALHLLPFIAIGAVLVHRHAIHVGRRATASISGSSAASARQKRPPSLET
jgi:uncharacterized protein (TIRG00374 family)